MRPKVHGPTAVALVIRYNRTRSTEPHTARHRPHAVPTVVIGRAAVAVWSCRWGLIGHHLEGKATAPSFFALQLAGTVESLF